MSSIKKHNNLPLKFIDEIEQLVDDMIKIQADLRANQKVKRESIDEKYVKAQLFILKNKQKFLTSEAMQIASLDKDKRLARKMKLKKSYAKLSHEQLLEKCAETTLEMITYALTARYLDGESKYLKKQFNSFWEKKLNTVTNQTQGKNLLFKSDNEYLLHCLNQIRNYDNEDLKPTDFIKFRNFAIKNDPSYVPKPRRTKEEQLMSDEIQLIDAESNKRTKWSDSKLRDFFEKHAKVKPSSVRK